MNPVVGLPLTQRALQPVQDLQRVSLLVDQDEQKFVGKARQRPFRATTSTALAHFACVGEIRGIRVVVCDLERRQQALELCQRSPRRS